MLLGAGLGGVDTAGATVGFDRTDVVLPAAPQSVAIGDLDGVRGKDVVVALPAPGSVGVLLNNGDGTLAAMQQYTAGPPCAGVAVDITLGDVTQPAPGDRLQPDGKLDAYVACTPDVVRLTGDGAGALTNPEPFNLGIQQYLGAATLDPLALMRRPDNNPVPLLVLQHAVGSFGRQLCTSYELDPAQLVCHSTPVEGPLAVGDLNGSAAGVPPDEIVTSVGTNKMGVFGFAPQFPLMWSDSTPRDVAIESAAVGDLDKDADLDIVVGQAVNSVSARVDSIHFFKWTAAGLDALATALPSTPGVDAVAIADVDGDACSDIVAGGAYGTGMVHLGDGTGGFDGGQDLPQIGYGNPATATRVTMAVDDLTGDGHPDLVVADQGTSVVMIYRNTSTPTGAACATATPTPTSTATAVPSTSPVAPTPTPTADPTVSPTPVPPAPRTCDEPGMTAFGVGTPGDDVLVGTAGRDVLSGRSGDDCVFGRAGDDRLSGGTGADALRGASGADRLRGDAGDDRLDGANGNDDIGPGAGKDKITAGGGDEITARDGTRDTIDCGAGRDKVVADRTDSVKRCETVKRSK
jgi:hypothetical protein